MFALLTYQSHLWSFISDTIRQTCYRHAHPNCRVYQEKRRACLHKIAEDLGRTPIAWNFKWEEVEREYFVNLYQNLLFHHVTFRPESSDVQLSFVLPWTIADGVLHNLLAPYSHCFLATKCRISLHSLTKDQTCSLQELIGGTSSLFNSMRVRIL